MRVERTTNYRADIDGLRAVAIVSVVAYHAFPNVVSGGFAGVDVFFVISGFLISGLIFRDLERGSFSFVEFYRRRIRRIVPALLIVLIVVWLIAWFVLAADDYAALGWHLSAASIFLSNFVLAHEAGYFDRVAEYKPLLHLWSLAVEEQFYLVWPVSIYAIWRLHLNSTAMLAAVGGISFGLNVVMAGPQLLWDFYGLPTRLWELALGAIVASFATGVGGRKIRNAMACIGFGLILVTVFILTRRTGYPGWAALAPTIGTALVVMAGSDSWINQKILSVRPMVLIGLISYPLYLWHWPLLAYARIALLKEPTPSIKVAIIGLATLLAWLTYEFIEKPVRSGLNRYPKSRRFAPIALVALLGVIGVIGLITREEDGFASRFPDPVRYLADYAYDYKRAYRDGICLLNQDQTERDFGSQCFGRSPTNSNGPLVFLWGDSHAGHLYPGLERIKGKAAFSLAQFTAAACPPIPDIDVKGSPHCREINDFVVRNIEELRPKVLVLAAQWWEVPINDLNALDLVIAHAKEAGIEHVVLVGPVPVWNPSLPKLLLRFYETSVPRHLPNRMGGALLFSDIEKKLRKIAAKEDIGFVSAIDVFCEQKECLTRTGSAPTDIVAWDSAHLTDAGSYLLAKPIAAMIGADVASRR